MGSLLQVDDLSIAFQTKAGLVQAVQGVSYNLEAGETLAVVGESGSGKSVHALAIAGLLNHPDTRLLSGTVRFDGRTLSPANPSQWNELRGRQIGFVFQDPMTALNPLLTIGRQLAAPLLRHFNLDRHAVRRRCIELLERVGITQAEQRLTDYPHQFSGGMRQRVLIAMAIASSPRLLIADEATTALDVTVQAQILDLIGELKRDLDLSIIWISHDLGVVARLADTVQVMYAGRVVERGPVDAVFHDPRHAYTLGLLRSIPSAGAERLLGIDGQPPDPVHLPVGDAFAPRNPYATSRCFLERPPLVPVDQGVPGHTAAAWYDLRTTLAHKAYP